jgi:hypothetical protein
MSSNTTATNIVMSSTTTAPNTVLLTIRPLPPLY